MRNINSVTLRGQLGSDPEIKEIAPRRFVARMSVATNIPYTKFNGEKNNETVWHNVVAWGDLVEAVRPFRKGDEIHVEGRIVHRRYTARTGDVRSITEIVSTLIKKPE